MKNLKLTVLATALAVVFSLSSAFAQGTSLAEEVEAAPKNWNVTIAVNTAGTLKNLDKDGGSLRDNSWENAYVMFSWKPEDSWKIGARARVRMQNKSFAEGEEGSRFSFNQLRLFAEKTGLIDTDVVGSKYTLRIHPQVQSGAGTNITQRFDVTLPISEVFGIRFRDEPELNLIHGSTHAGLAVGKDGDGNNIVTGGKTFFDNELEATPYVAVGGFYGELSAVFFQTVSTLGSWDLGLGAKLYLAYNITDSLAIGWYTEAKKTFGVDFAFANIYSEVELAFNI